jgi:hypothetical protein
MKKKFYTCAPVDHLTDIRRACAYRNFFFDSAVEDQPTGMTRRISTEGTNPDETQKAEIPREAGPANGPDRRLRAGDAAVEPEGDRDGLGAGSGECQD